MKQILDVKNIGMYNFTECQSSCSPTAFFPYTANIFQDVPKVTLKFSDLHILQLFISCTCSWL